MKKSYNSLRYRITIQTARQTKKTTSWRKKGKTQSSFSTAAPLDGEVPLSLFPMPGDVPPGKAALSIQKPPLPAEVSGKGRLIYLYMIIFSVFKHDQREHIVLRAESTFGSGTQSSGRRAGEEWQREKRDKRRNADVRTNHGCSLKTGGLKGGHDSSRSSRFRRAFAGIE